MSDILSLAQPYRYDPPPEAWLPAEPWQRLHATIIAREPRLAGAPPCQLARLARQLYARLPSAERSLGALLPELLQAWTLASIWSESATAASDEEAA